MRRTRGEAVRAIEKKRIEVTAGEASVIMTPAVADAIRKAIDEQRERERRSGP